MLIKFNYISTLDLAAFFVAIQPFQAASLTKSTGGTTIMTVACLFDAATQGDADSVKAEGQNRGLTFISQEAKSCASSA